MFDYETINIIFNIITVLLVPAFIAVYRKLSSLDDIGAEVKRLREEHRDIQGNQQRTDEKINKFADDVGTKVETIMRDHNLHEVGQARIEGKLDELIRKDVK